MCTRNSGQSRRKRRICSRRQVCSAELRLMTMEEGTAVLESYTVVRTSGVANQDGRCLSVPSVRPMSWFDLDKGHYETGVKISKEQMKALNLRPHQQNPEWNYSLRPR